MDTEPITAARVSPPCDHYDMVTWDMDSGRMFCVGCDKTMKWRTPTPREWEAYYQAHPEQRPVAR